eukprot:TRINITY_DN24451_c0_g1_i1.p1 TRINITY_DN24451_c0_g1~~TRINITY_DN24451_c0_g1_i1.p1  ORF type:complete len:142 (-),score=22.58 TRINITY_DN24451_c0_g1_i1:28-453(-)
MKAAGHVAFQAVPLLFVILLQAPALFCVRRSDDGSATSTWLQERNVTKLEELDQITAAERHTTTPILEKNVSEGRLAGKHSGHALHSSRSFFWCIVFNRVVLIFVAVWASLCTFSMDSYLMTLPCCGRDLKPPKAAPERED